MKPNSVSLSEPNLWFLTCRYSSVAEKKQTVFLCVLVTCDSWQGSRVGVGQWHSLLIWLRQVGVTAELLLLWQLGGDRDHTTAVSSPCSSSSDASFQLLRSPDRLSGVGEKKKRPLSPVCSPACSSVLAPQWWRSCCSSSSSSCSSSVWPRRRPLSSPDPRTCWCSHSHWSAGGWRQWVTQEAGPWEGSKEAPMIWDAEFKTSNMHFYLI